MLELLYHRGFSVGADLAPLIFSQEASKKHRESASYLYDAHGSGSGKSNMRDRNNRYTSRHKVRAFFVWLCGTRSVEYKSRSAENHVKCAKR